MRGAGACRPIQTLRPRQSAVVALGGPWYLCRFVAVSRPAYHALRILLRACHPRQRQPRHAIRSARAMSKRRPFIAGNWKMNLDRLSSVELAQAIVRRAGEVPHVELGVCPPFVYLDAVRGVVHGTPVALGGQNMYFQK